MKGFNLSKVVGAGVLSLSLVTLPLTLPAFAQTDTASPNAMQGTENAEEGDRDFDWGWLGLIGLAGLAGLAKKREEPVRYRDPDPANRSGL